LLVEGPLCFDGPDADVQRGGDFPGQGTAGPGGRRFITPVRS
jgi:hypothetical protein